MHNVQIRVQTSDGHKDIYEIDLTQHVGELKTIIGRKMNVPEGFRSRLTYKGRVLPNESILKDVGVRRMSILQLLWHPLPKHYRESELRQKQTVKKNGQEHTSHALQDDKKEKCKPAELGSAHPIKLECLPANCCILKCRVKKNNDCLDLQVPRHVNPEAGAGDGAGAAAGEDLLMQADYASGTDFLDDLLGDDFIYED